MNRAVKRLAQVVLPERVFSTLQSIRSRNSQKRQLARAGVRDATREAAERYGLCVLDGPFRGMKYPRESLLDRNGIPVLFGAYELELHGAIEEVALRRYDAVVDLGAAEGCYAVGLALRTGARVYAFDCEPRERAYCRRMARENGVDDLVRVRGWCSRETLCHLAGGRSLVISDCEGYEAELFSPDVAAALRHADLIIELHEVPGVDVRGAIRATLWIHTARAYPSAITGDTITFYGIFKKLV